ncbi:N-acetylmuramoyl-L-alanine amidase [Haloactinospora alba]|uniref:N-acetylmuramoyl-L-alanine amidase n=1 Tax=Haloactinospora alba TaxID=405555 RepID=A0A543NNM1_9ACTN|nr:peptidoglycan recognition family protein [Haloactinospora alba]TQN33376.1 N-acetylmuramoyl-L-alanine amidase [Haloactinospora alba]
MPEPTRFTRRSDLGWPSESPASDADPKNGLVIHYDSNDQNLANRPHSACVDYWNSVRDYHVNTNGWDDLGYSFLACAHGYVVEGRGTFKEQAAQRGDNDTYYSCSLANGPTDPITGDQIEAVRELRAWLMEPETSIAGTVVGHRDLSATACPGDTAYALVQDDVFAQPPTGSNPEGDEMPTYVSINKSDDAPAEGIERGEWSQIHFDANISNGSDNHHTSDDPTSLLRGPCDYSG